MGSPARSARTVGRGRVAATAAAVILHGGCAQVGRLQNVGHTVSPAPGDSTEGERELDHVRPPLFPLFGDPLIGLMPGTADSTVRFLGRLRAGYTADTLNVILCGDNRPGYRLRRLQPQLRRIRQGLSPNPFKIVRGLVNIPWAIVSGLYPDLALIREIPSVVRRMPKASREHQVMGAMMARVDSLEARGQSVAAVINTGDLVHDGQYPAQWERFLRITRPLTSRVPYFPVAGNHERTDTLDGVENWRAATGLPVAGDRLYYCFDSADGWVRFVALDSNPIVNAQSRWTREAQVEYTEEQFTWLAARVREHTGPVIVMMHHPPFSASAHRMEWQADSLLIGRRERMVASLRDAGISIIASGHEHGYQRALLTWPDAVLVVLISGGAGSPLHQLPPPAESARLFGEYEVAGSVVKPENVSTNQVFNFTLLRLWFGGGDLCTYAVDEHAQTKLIDNVQIDLRRYGIPEIDQYKVPVAPSTGPKEVAESASSPDSAGARVDSTSAGELPTEPPAGGNP